MIAFQHTDYVCGNEVFFIEKGVPHTGIVKQVYSNMLILEHVTFVDPIFDKTTREPIEYSQWEVRPKDVIKTSEYYLPKHPNIETLVYVEQLMHSATNDNQLESVNVRDFLKEYRPKTLYSSESSLFYPYPDNYIRFNPNMILLMKDSISVCVPLIFKFKGKLCYALEAYESESLTQPTMIVIPNWLDHERKSNINDYTLMSNDGNKLKSLLQKIYQKRANILNISLVLPEIYISDINEGNIEKIYQMNEITKKFYFGINRLVSESGCYVENGEIKIKYTYFNPIYKKRR